MGAAVTKKKILAVGDWAREPKAVSGLPTGKGYDVEAVADGWLAVRKVREGAFDLAVIDVDSPPFPGLEVSGWDLLLVFRALHPTIPVVLISADGRPEAKTRSQLLRAAKFLMKPIDPEELNSVVRAVSS